MLTIYTHVFGICWYTKVVPKSGVMTEETTEASKTRAVPGTELRYPGALTPAEESVVPNYWYLDQGPPEMKEEWATILITIFTSMV